MPLNFLFYVVSYVILIFNPTKMLNNCVYHGDMHIYMGVNEYLMSSCVACAATIATYFVVAEQTILECSRKQNATNLEKSRAGLS